LKKYEEKKAHNMFLMLDPKVKNLCLISSFIYHEQSKAIVEKYDKKTLCLILLKCHHHLHLLFKNNIIRENCNLDIFEMIITTNEPKKELVNRELLISKRF